MLKKLSSFTLVLILASILSTIGKAQTIGPLRAQGVLPITGSTAEDRIEFSIDGNELVVTANGNESRFPTLLVAELEVRTFGGDDTIRNFTDVAMRAEGGPGNDHIVGGSGDDLLLGNGEDDYIVGGSGDDLLLGDGGDDQLFGLDGNDTLIGGLGVDRLSGGNGDDALRPRGDQFEESDFGGETDVYFGGPGNDLLENGNEMSGGPGNDLIISRGGSVIHGGPGDDEIYRQGSLTVVSGGGGSDSLIHFQGISTEVSIGFLPFNDLVLEWGGIAAEVDAACGFGCGNDQNFVGGLGVDSVDGVLEGPGIIFQPFLGRVLATGNAVKDIIDFRVSGNSLVASLESGGTRISRSFALAQVRTITARGMQGPDEITNSSPFPIEMFGDQGLDELVQLGDADATLDGGLHDDLLVHAGNGGTVFYLSASNPRTRDVIVNLKGENGDDTLINAGTGPVSLTGSFGNDTYMTNTDGDRAFEFRGENEVFMLNGGTVNYRTDSSLFKSVIVTGSEKDETVELAGDVPSGRSVVVQIDLGGGDDHCDSRFLTAPAFVNGGPGNDVIMGGGSILSGGELSGGAGDDKIELSVFSSGPGTAFGGPGNDIITGSLGDDFLFGGSGDDLIRGDDGDDIMRGEGGNDDLVAGSGNDTLFGGPGNDTLRGQDGNDELNGQGGIDELFGGPGTNVLNQ